MVVVATKMSLIVLSLALLLLQQPQVKASLMGKGLSNTWLEKQNHHYQRPKSFDAEAGLHHNRHGLTAENEEAEKSSEVGGKTSSRPCVGLCYYEKLMALEGKMDTEKSPNDTVQDEKKDKRRPCVGLCQYYRSLGLQDPSELKHKRLLP